MDDLFDLFCLARREPIGGVQGADVAHQTLAFKNVRDARDAAGEAIVGIKDRLIGQGQFGAV